MNLLRGKYAAGDIPAEGQLYVLEGVSGIGKSTLSALLAERLGGTTLHTLPEPLTAWSAQVNSALRPLPQLGFYLSGLLHASDLVRNSSHTATSSRTVTPLRSSPVTPPFTASTSVR
ncbi:hypothetical protein [Streptomyces sp. C8S0]|uniref:hypothetical protein n=1 Tax=Streptomyces sp. C8S0 TaxID=2585716 RepID=UPI001D0406C9|nr:hypothetical protein [Streptomyces sp. C8S0]